MEVKIMTEESAETVKPSTWKLMNFTPIAVGGVSMELN